MAVTINTLALSGLSPTLIDVELSFVRGQPQLVFIGLPNRIITEAKERITTALQHYQIRLRSKRTVVNLAPADLHKSDSYYELPIAIGLLHLHSLIRRPKEKTVYFGEFSLDGCLKPLKNTIPLLRAAAQLGFKQAVIPTENLKEARLVSDIKVFPVSNLSQVLSSNFLTKPANPQNSSQISPARPSKISFTNIDPLAVRLMEISAAGGHNLMLVGPPGVGKSSLLSAFSSILPPMTVQEKLEVLSIQAIADKKKDTESYDRPFRSPHHSTSSVGLLGGGANLKPGEISLAHNGVLFLDELTEFSKPVLESIREPMTQHQIAIRRSKGQVIYPALSIILAACNPCSCGFYQSTKTCRCTPQQIQQYRQKISGPFADRFDLQLNISGSNYDDSPIAVSNTKIIKAQKVQNIRYGITGLAGTNGKVSTADFLNKALLGKKELEYLKKACFKLKLSMRSLSQVWRVARTIADLDFNEKIKKSHIAEALQYQNRW